MKPLQNRRKWTNILHGNYNVPFQVSQKKIIVQCQQKKKVFNVAHPRNEVSNIINSHSLS
jgi:hypothetical protein